MNPRRSDPFQAVEISDEVAQALAGGRPVVALETTVVTHGIPRPENLGLARDMESAVRSEGAVPATVAILRGRASIGVSDPELERLAKASSVLKVNSQNLGYCVASGKDGGTTVSASVHLACVAGIRVMATGGIGGVHRGQSGDVSSDLPELARSPVAVVCSGAKAILDLPRTLEWLETYGVPVIGYGTDEFPAFFSRSSGLHLDLRANNPEEVAEILQAHWSLNPGCGVLICVPCPEERALPAEEVELAVARALASGETGGISGKDVTPFLLNELNETTKGATLIANLALLLNNACVAAQIARACCAQR
jgi:pseudouridine-5'-phosphate glycosidase